MTWDTLESDRACAALALLSGEISHREAMRRLMESGLDEIDAAIWLADSADEKIAR